MNIITLTLSPAIDVHCHADRFFVERENFANITSRDVGGKGINISRALLSHGVQNTAIVAVGKENADAFLSALSAENINLHAISVKGRIRENITIHANGAKETRLSFDGFSADGKLLDEVKKLTDNILKNGDLLAIAGSIPSDVEISSIKRYIKALKIRGVKVIIDSRSLSIDDVVECAPFLIKPNGEEISAYMGKEVFTASEAVKTANEIFKKGVENVMISLGEQGAVLACADGVFTAKAPKIEAISTIGAGDSSIAGFIAAYKDGKSAAECLKSAVAFGSAACLTEGTKAPQKEDISRLLKEIKTIKL